MEVSRIFDDKSFQIYFNLGNDYDGKPIIKKRTYGMVEETATDEVIYSVAQSIVGLQEHGYDKIMVDEKNELIEG